MSKSFDDLLTEGDAALKSGIGSIVANLGKTVAAITLLVACLVTFTDVSIGEIRVKDYFGTLAVMVTSAYLMYFSLLDVGEKRGEESEEYKSAKERYVATRVKFSGDMMYELRKFCHEYSLRELEERRSRKLLLYGYTTDDLDAAAKDGQRRRRRILRRIERMRSVPLSARTLLSFDKRCCGTELSNPDRGRLLRSFVKLLPSVVCMCVTVSVVLSVKDGMSTRDVINGILKLSTLPIIGIRGYTAGIVYSTYSKSAWLETKSRILESFFESLEK